MKIRLNRSTVLEGGLAKKPSPAQLVYGELAVNYNTDDPALFLKDSNDNIIQIAGVDAVGNYWSRTSTTLSPVNPGDDVDIGSGNITLNADGSATFAGSVQVPAGTAALPGLTPVGDLDTGIYSPGSDQLALSTNGGEAARIDSLGYFRLSAKSGGIQFNGETAASNALNDYEEGIWTPTPGDMSAGTATTPSTAFFTSSGVYTKIGNTITVEGIFNVGDSGTDVTITDRFSIAGLPYPMPNGDYGGVGTFGGRGPTSPLSLNNMTFGTIQVAGGSSVMYFSFEKLLGGITQTYDQQLSFSFTYSI